MVRRPFRLTFFLFLAALFGAAFQPTGADTRYSFLRLPISAGLPANPTENDYHAKADLAINNRGQVAATRIVGNDGALPVYQAVFWDRTTGLHTIPNAPGFTSARALGINNLGHVVGEMRRKVATSNPYYVYQAFLWDSVNGTRLVPNTLGGGSVTAYCLNDNDTIVGGASDPSGNTQAFVSDNTNGMQLITNTVNTSGGGTNAVAYGINNAGQVVGMADTGSTDSNGNEIIDSFSATTPNNMSNTSPGWSQSAATTRAVNKKGDQSGDAQAATGGDYHGFVLMAAPGGISDIHQSGNHNGTLGDLKLGTGDYPEGINDNDVIVGTVKYDRNNDANNPNYDFHAFVWDSYNQMRDLNDLLPTGAGITLVQAGGVNNRGQVICWDSAGDAILLSPLKNADFNGDGRADLIFQNASSSQISFWFMNGATFTGGGTASSHQDPTYRIAGVDDFNGDGKPDLVFQNQTTRQLAIWGMNGVNVTASGFFTRTPDPGWNLVGVGDFDGDGKPDLVFQNQTTNQIAVWFMNGLNLASSAFTSITPAAGWKVVGVGDFNGDGLPDLVFQNSTTGQISVWFMNGTTYLGGALVSMTPPSGWKVVGVGDFNGDGKLDLALQNPSTGQTVLWFLNGTTFVSGTSTSITPGVGWNIVGPR